MKLDASILLLAILSLGPGAGGLAAQGAPEPAGTSGDGPRAPLPPARAANGCEPAGVSAGTVSDPAPSPGLSASPVVPKRQVPFCSPSVPRQPEDDGGEWYGRRLALHRYSAWAAVAAFPVEIYTGSRLLDDGADPDWVRDTHTGTVWVLGTTFTMNTVTGVWNWWDSRREPEGRRWRNAHALVMVAADAAMFATARAGQAAARGESRERHQTLAFTTVGLTAVGHLMMLRPFRRD